MSQYPYQKDPGNPAPYDPYGTPSYQAAARPKPGSITVLAVLAIVFGSLFSLCTGFATIVDLLQIAGVKLITGPAAQIKVTPALQAFGLSTAVLELGLCLALLMIGIGALSLKRWARRAATSWWPVVMIVWAFVRLIAQVFWIGPASLEALKQMQQSTPGISTQQMQKFMGAGMVGGAIFILLIQLLLPILFLTLWRSPDVIGAFEGGGA